MPAVQAVMVRSENTARERNMEQTFNWVSLTNLVHVAARNVDVDQVATAPAV